ncbi:MAG: RnfABCDGE type electron transport complex subunit G [Oscillospiraceae bacterium]|nr:RnfABCDGE type electron transport complex subunit G [Oscillospiraceae bacterium]
MSKQTQEAAQAPLSIDPKYTGRLVATLTAICLVTALLLGIVNQVTKPRIDAIQKAKQWTAMTAVLQAKVYEPVETSEPYVKALYRATGLDGFEGWVVETSTSGSQGTIEMMVGVDPEGKVTGVSVVSHSETPNIGTKVVADQTVLDRFIGMSHEGGEITVNSGTNRFDGVTGATYSSKGVAAGVNAALAAVGGPAA